MSSQHSILRALRGRSSVSLPDPSRFSFSFTPNGPFNTPVVPSVYITAPEEEGNLTWCAIDGDVAFSLDVPLPDIALLERTIENLRKATTSASSHTSMFRRPSKKHSVVRQSLKPEVHLSERRESQTLESQTTRQQRVVFADTNGRVHLESVPERPRSPMRVFSPPPTVPKGGSLRVRASKVLQVFKPRRSNTSPSVLAPHSPSENLPATPESSRFSSRRLRRGVSLMFKRSDPALQVNFEKTLVDSLGIYTLPHPVDRVHPSPPAPSRPQHVELACPPLTSPPTPIPPDKPLPPLPAHDPTLRSHQSNPALSLAKQPKRRFSLTDLRHKWIQPARTDSSTSTTDASTESSGSSAAASSVEQEDSRPISRSPGRRMIIESMHFPDLDLRFDAAPF